MMNDIGWGWHHFEVKTFTRQDRVGTCVQARRVLGLPQRQLRYVHEHQCCMWCSGADSLKAELNTQNISSERKQAM